MRLAAVDLGIVTVLSALRQLHLRVTAQIGEIERLRSDGAAGVREAERELRRLVAVEQRIIRSMASAVDLCIEEETT
jgi:hypothetical protein